jgi:hypothetical protein
MADVEEPTIEVEPQEEEEVVDEDDDEEPQQPPHDELDEDYVAISGATEIKLFGKWAFDDIEVRDISLVVRFIF